MRRSVLQADLHGAKHLSLMVGDCDDGIEFDHADWAGAVLVLTPGADPAAANDDDAVEVGHRPAIVHEESPRAGHSRPANRRQHAGPGVPVSHSGHGRKAAALCRQESAGGPHARSRDRHHQPVRSSSRARPSSKSKSRTPAAAPARVDDRRRPTQAGPHAADGLELVELLGQRGQRRQGPRRGRCHGQERPGGPRLPIRQHRRLLGRQARCQRRDPDQREVPRHEGPGRLRSQQGSEAGHLFVARAEDLRRLRSKLEARSPGRRDLCQAGASIT